MKRCPITYQSISNNDSYSKQGLSLLSQKLSILNPLQYSAQEQRLEAIKRAGKMSIQGVQPKLSARLSVPHATFEVVDTKGTYILKPPHAYYANLPENEDLTMRLATIIKIKTPIHGLLWGKDQTLTYFIKRFDRFGKGKKREQEDFAQLSNHTRHTKYDSSIEQAIEIIEKYCTFPAIEKVRFFKLVLFSFIVGNEDQHLKNFSLLTTDGKIELSPAYDLLNTTLAIPSCSEEMALPLKGKKSNLTRNDFIKHLAKERLLLADRVLDNELILLKNVQQDWEKLIESSFLPDDQKSKYWAIVRSRVARIL
jgi:serine/threonine-protein kinase HipA